MLYSLLVLFLRGVQLPNAESELEGLATRETDEAGSKPLSQTEIRIISAWGLLLAALSAASLASCLFGAS